MFRSESRKVSSRVSCCETVIFNMLGIFFFDMLLILSFVIAPFTFIYMNLSKRYVDRQVLYYVFGYCISSHPRRIVSNHSSDKLTSWRNSSNSLLERDALRLTPLYQGSNDEMPHYVKHWVLYTLLLFVAVSWGLISNMVSDIATAVKESIV